MNDKPTLYLLPGLLCDRTIWQAQIAQLGTDFDIRVPSFADQASLDAMAQLVLDDAPHRFAVAGHSMGGRVAMIIAQRAPERVERLALLDTGVHPVRPNERGNREHLALLAEQEGMRALAQAWLPPMVSAHRHSDESLMRPLFAMVESMTPAIYRAQMEALLHRPDAEPWLAQITCPTLVGVGSNDQWSPPSQHRAMADQIPAAVLTIFAEAGHMAPAENPGAVTDALRRWMTLT